MKTKNPSVKAILSVPMKKNDANAKTIGEYLQKLLILVWDLEEDFHGKRPYGNSGWKQDIELALINAGMVSATLDEDGFIESMDESEERKVDDLIHKAIIGSIK